MVHVGVEWLGIVMYHMSDNFTGQKSNLGDPGQSNAHFFDIFNEFSVCLKRGFRPIVGGYSHVFFPALGVFLHVFVSRNFISAILSIRFGISSRTCELRVSG